MSEECCTLSHTIDKHTAPMSYSIFENSETPPQQHYFDVLRFSYDNLASEALEQLLKSSTASKGLYPRLAERKKSDTALKEFWDQATYIPPWVDWAKVRRGQIVFNRYILPIALGFAFQGFAGEIAAAVGPAEVLVRAGGLSRNHIHQRIARTLQWLMDVTESLPSIQPGGKWHASTIEIRLLHARVRRRIAEAARSRPEYYDSARHGVPINAHDMILTLTFFCCKPIWAQFPRLWIHPRANEIEDFVALWRYLAHLLGVPNEHFASAAMAKQTMDMLDQRKKVQCEASQHITHAFLDAFADRAPFKLSHGFLQAGIWAMNPVSTCVALEVPRPNIVHRTTFVSLKACTALLVAAQKRVCFFDTMMQKVCSTPWSVVTMLTKYQVPQEEDPFWTLQQPGPLQSVTDRVQISCDLSRR